VKAIVLTGNFDLDCMFVMISIASTRLIKGVSVSVPDNTDTCDYIELCHFHVNN